MKIKNLWLAVLALSLLAAPAFAQKSRSNKGGASLGDARVDQVQAENQSKKSNKKSNKKKDKDRDRDNDKNKGKHNGETKGTAKGHSH